MTGGGELRTFSFAAVTSPDGTVTGAVEVKNRALDVRAHSEIDCIKFVAPNRAIMSGTIARSSDPAFIAPGRISVVGVEDNGEGAGANPGVVVRPLIEIAGGDIQLEPQAQRSPAAAGLRSSDCYATTFSALA